MERTLLKKMLAIGLSAAMAFTAAPFLAQNTEAIEAEAADTLTVTYTVQVNQNENMFSSIMSSINAARAPKTSAENNADSSGTTTSASGTDLVYNGDIEQFAIDRAQDLALYNTTDGTKPNGNSEMTADAEKAGVEAFVTYSGALNSTPADDWSKNASVLNTEYKSAGIGHVTYADQEFYCIVLSKNATPSKNTVDYTKTQIISPVTNYLAYNNVGKIYAKYSYNGSSDFTPVEFVDGNGLSTAKYPGTINVTYGQSAEIPTLKYAVSPKNVSGASSDSVYEISQPAAIPTVNDSNGISVSGNQVTGKTIGSYTVSYVDSVAGKKTSFDIPVTVAAADLSGGTMIVDNSKKYYANGTASEPDVTIKVGNKTLTKDTDYTLAYANNNPATSVTNPQKATITATGKGNYTGTLTGDFTIQPSTGGDLTGATITVTEKNIVYDGKEKKPKATVVLNGVTVPESSYTLKYSNNVKAGTATIVAAAKSGDERYSKTAKGTFKIAQADLSTADFTFADSDNKSNTSPQYSYTGADIKPEPGIKVDSLTLTKNTDFTYSYSNNKAIGTQAAVTVTGKGNFTGTASMNFEITQGDITKATVTATPSSTFTYNGQRQYPSYVMVSIDGHQLTQGVDYDLSPFPTDAVNAGTYRYTITGKNNFKGTGTTTATGTTSGTGSTSTSSTTNTTSTNGTTSSDNAIVSTDKAAGTITAQYTIQAKDVSKASDISVPKISDKTYNGKAQKPAVTVVDNTRGAVLTEGTDYTRTDASNTTPGTATVTLTFSGNYTGTKTLSYKIVPKKTSISRVSAGKKKATVSYKKVSGISGYQVKAGTNRAVTEGTKTKNTTKTKYTMNSLKSKKRYYFKVRTYYTTSAGKKAYSSWSGVKSVKVK
ncbi:MAG: hypothetical protein SOY96_08495 [Lachnospiraceae bacterium]|nr:hypothetical protein [Lachnospiraceae bacterium]